jgi:hypothetical protein
VEHQQAAVLEWEAHVIVAHERSVAPRTMGLPIPVRPRYGSVRSAGPRRADDHAA